VGLSCAGVDIVTTSIKSFFLFFFIVFASTTTMVAFWSFERDAWRAFEEGNYKEAEQILYGRLIDSPSNAFLNYNLGILHYKSGKFKDAKNDFQRVFENSERGTGGLRGESYFNWGNCSISVVSFLLGDKWEKENLGESSLGTAILEVRSAIEKYKNAQALLGEQEKVKKNLEKAEELLKKLEAKNEQQKQQKKSQDQSSEKNKDDKGQKGDKQSDRNNKPDNTQNPRDDREDDRPGDDDRKDGEQDKSQHDGSQNKEQQSEQKTSSQNKEMKQGAQEMESSSRKEPGETMEMKGVRALLDKLQEDEKKLQKVLMRKKGKEGEKKRRPNQKPW
jgi:Ca-activated chloride channel homolog